ncbi:MAG: ankyrin repeat domain-containing protein, partial [Lentisphaeria bacterium]|nr:ankyrin repeat domain-containing protein [Lentisphaeria bacterium]
MNFKKIVPVLAIVLAASGCADPELTQSQKDLLAAVRAPENSELTAKLADLCAENKENLNFRDPENGQTPLIAAVITNRPESVKTILESGIVIRDKQDAKGMTALHYAVGQVGTENVNLLGGVSVNLKDRYGKTPLMEACRLGNADMVKAVLATGDANSFPGRECNV